MDAIALALLVAVAAGAGWLLALGGPDRVGIAGTLLGGVLGFVTGWLTERARRREENRHRFESDRRALYGRFLEAVTASEGSLTTRSLAAKKRVWLTIPSGENAIPEEERMLTVWVGPVAQLVDEIELMSPPPVHTPARAMLTSLDDWDSELIVIGKWNTDSWPESEENGRRESYARQDKAIVDSHNRFIRQRDEFIRAAKKDLGTSTGMPTPWEIRRRSLQSRIARVRRLRATQPAAIAGENLENDEPTSRT